MLLLHLHLLLLHVLLALLRVHLLHLLHLHAGLATLRHHPALGHHATLHGLTLLLLHLHLPLSLLLSRGGGGGGIARAHRTLRLRLSLLLLLRAGSLHQRLIRDVHRVRAAELRVRSPRRVRLHPSAGIRPRALRGELSSQLVLPRLRLRRAVEVEPRGVVLDG